MQRSSHRMYFIDEAENAIEEVDSHSLSADGFRELQNLQSWVAENPEILGEELTILSSGHTLGSRKQLDLLALDADKNVVVVELKRDSSGATVDWQALRYVGQVARYDQDTLSDIAEDYFKKTNRLEDYNPEDIFGGHDAEVNQNQRIILVSGSFHTDVCASVMWLREQGVDISCVQVSYHRHDAGGNKRGYLVSQKIIPLPQVEDLTGPLQQRGASGSEGHTGRASSHSTKIPDGITSDRVRDWIVDALRLNAVNGRLLPFLEILSELAVGEAIDRDEIKQKLHHDKNIGTSVSHAGRLLSNVSQYITKTESAPLRAAISYESDGGRGAVKDNFSLNENYREAVIAALHRADEASAG